MINDYSPGVLLAWQSNVDVQFLWNGSSFAVDYTTSYASKSEKPKEGSRVQRAIKDATTSKSVSYSLFAINLYYLHIIITKKNNLKSLK